MSRCWLGWALAPLLVGCAGMGGLDALFADTPAPPDPAAAATARVPDRWQATGRLAAILPHQAWNANFDWRQDGPSYHIELQGPFGQGAATVTGTNTQVSLRLADGQTHTSSDPESLLARQLGWRAPVSALRYWMAGQPLPSLVVESPRRNTRGQWLGFTQSGWRIEYPDAQESAAALPRRIWLEQDDLSLRIVVTRWQLP